MKKGIFIFLLGFIIFCGFKALHPYHVGALNVEYNSTSKTFEMMGTFFMDDLENSVNKTRKSKVFFNKKNHEELMNKALESWAKSNLSMKVNGQPLKVNFLGFEEDKESVHVYLESVPISSPKSLELGMSMLYNIFDDQLNIIHITINGKRKSHKLRYPKKYLKVS